MTARPLRLDHVTILVRSAEASLPFYRALLPLLGFVEEREMIWADGEGLYIQFGEARPETRDYERYGPGMNHLGFGAPDPETVEHVRAAMQTAGHPVPEIQRIGRATALFMKDPDGIRFEVTHYPPGVPVVS